MGESSELVLRASTIRMPTLYRKQPTILEVNSQIESYSTINSLDFDAFEFKECINDKELAGIVSFLFEKYNLFTNTCIDSKLFYNFISEIHDGYVATNPYHNATHATDVVQYSHFLLETCKAYEICKFKPIDRAICLFSAAIHDFKHPGKNNFFLINTYSPLALLYNDKSVLENHHIAAAFSLATQDDKDIFKSLSPIEFFAFRSKVVSIVLATDMAKHFKAHGKFKNKFISKPEIADESDLLMVMGAVIHAADISNPTRKWETCFRWTQLVLEEFFDQGDQERALGLPISHLCDRETIRIPESQIGFIDVIIEPTFVNLSIVIPAVSEIVLPCLIENKRKWADIKNQSTSLEFNS